VNRREQIRVFRREKLSQGRRAYPQITQISADFLIRKTGTEEMGFPR